MFARFFNVARSHMSSIPQNKGWLSHARSQQNQPSFFKKNFNLRTLPIKPLPKPLVAAWDLDDTLWKSDRFFRECINKARKMADEQPWSEKNFNTYLNKFGYTPIKKLFDDMFFGDFAKSKHAQKHFYRIFETSIPDKNLLLPHAENILDYLKQQKVTLVVVSNLEEVFAHKLLRDFGISHYFSAIITNTDGNNIKPSPQPLLMALNQVGIKPGKHVWMIGDTIKYDIACAQAAGCSGILFGSSMKPQLGSIKPDAITHSHAELKHLFELTLKPEETNSLYPRQAAE